MLRSTFLLPALMVTAVTLSGCIVEDHPHQQAYYRPPPPAYYHPAPPPPAYYHPAPPPPAYYRPPSAYHPQPQVSVGVHVTE